VAISNLWGLGIFRAHGLGHCKRRNPIAEAEARTPEKYALGWRDLQARGRKNHPRNLVELSPFQRVLFLSMERIL